MDLAISGGDLNRCSDGWDNDDLTHHTIKDTELPKIGMRVKVRIAEVWVLYSVIGIPGCGHGGLHERIAKAPDTTTWGRCPELEGFMALESPCP